MKTKLVQLLLRVLCVDSRVASPFGIQILKGQTGFLKERQGKVTHLESFIERR